VSESVPVFSLTSPYLKGRGIFLTRTFENVPQHENVVAQLYIKKPLLLDGFKFDLRICECFVVTEWSIFNFPSRSFCTLICRLFGCFSQAVKVSGHVLCLSSLR
jgi:thiamine pyrophosphokinase